MGKISNFIIGMVLVGFFMTGIGLYMSNLSKNYNTTYDNSTIVIYDNYEELKEQTKEMKETVLAEENKTGNIITNTVDLIGDFFKSGYTALKVSKSSLETFNQMTSNSVDKLNAGDETGVVSSVLKNTLIILVLIFVVFTIISVLVNRDV